MAKDLEISFLLDFYGDAVTEKQRQVMEQYYNDDLSLSEIADNFGITRQGVRDSIKRGETVILDLEEKVGFAKKYLTIQRGVEKILAEARNLKFHNQNYTKDVKLQEYIENIIKTSSEIIE